MSTKLILASMLMASAGAMAQKPYHLELNADAPDGTKIYLVNYDTKARIDSADIAGGKAVFDGAIDRPVLIQGVTGSNNRLGMYILEDGNITVTDGAASGTRLNNEFEALGSSIELLGMQMQQATDEATAEAIMQTYNDLLRVAMESNIDNPIGYYIFLQQAYEMDADEFMAAIAKYPVMEQYERIQGIRDVFGRKAATAPGKMFTDFEVTYDGATHRLSDYVGKGNYTLVDFWASWCGPCIRETAVIKDLYKEYGPKGLEVVGFAVWDEPDDTLDAINRLQLPWHQVINAQTIPTDIYGILGIPCIILFAPDGTIVARDLQDDALRQAVADAFAN